MVNHILFFDSNKSSVSDYESLCFINPSMNVIGGTGIINEGIDILKKNPEINVIVITQNLIDGDIIAAMKAVSDFGGKKIVVIKEANELLQKSIENMGGICTLYPLDYNRLECLLSVENEHCNIDYINEEVEKGKVNNTGLQDNPFANITINNPGNETSDIKDKLRMVRREKTVESGDRIFSQKVIAVHNPKGGVGKSTIAMETAIAIRRFVIVKDGEQRQPKVCLCDFDLSANDLVAMLNLPERQNIGCWYNDLHTEAKRIAEVKGAEEPISNIIFTEKEIKAKYLKRHESGIYVLSAPESSKIFNEISSDDINVIINNLRICDFDVIIIDTGPNLLDYTISTLIEADEILAVSTCELISARRLDSVIRKLSEIPGCPLSKIKLVINKYDQLSNIEVKEIIDVLRLELYGTIPYFNEMSNVHNEGYSAFYNKVAANKQANASFIESINVLAKKIVGIDKIEKQSGTPHKKGIFSKILKGKNK